MNRKRVLLKAIGAAATLPGLTIANQTWARKLPEEDGYFPDVKVQTHTNKTLNFYSDLLKGKLVVFNMMYTACTNICPPNTASLLNVQTALGERVGRDIFMYSITLQPEIDTPQALNEYAQRYGIKPGWTFLRAKRHDMELIRRKLGFFNTDPVADADISKHTGMIRVGNEPRDRWFMMPAVSSTRQIVSAIMNA